MFKYIRLTSLMVALVGSLVLAPATVLAQPTNTVNSTVAVETPSPSVAPSTTPTPQAADAETNSLTQLPEIDCAGRGFGLKWVICPVIKIVYRGMYVVFDNFIKPMLDISPLNMEADNPLQIVWRAVRDLTNALLVLVFLFIIFGNASSIGIDAYSFKKAIPRLIVAAVAIQASFLLTAMVIDLGNILGAGLEGLAKQAFLDEIGQKLLPNGTGAGPISSSSLAAGIVIAGVAGIATALELWAFLLPLVIVAGFSMVSLLLAVFARQLIISILVVAAPLAIAAWVLPNTERYFKMWWENLFKAVMMYPLLILLFIMGNTVALVGNAAGGMQQVMAMFGPLVAFILAPGAFRWAGSITAGVSERFRRRVGGYGQKVATPLRSNISAGRKEKAYIMATNQDASALNKFRGRVNAEGIGAFTWGKMATQTNRRLAAGGKHARHARLEDELARLHNLGIENPDYGRLAAAHTGDVVTLRDGRKVVANHETQEAAISALGSNGGIPELISIFDKTLNLKNLHTQFRKNSADIDALIAKQKTPGGLTGAEAAQLQTLQDWMLNGDGKTYRKNREVWDLALGSNRGGILPSAPHLIHGLGMDAYQDTKGQILEKLHGRAAADLIEGARVSAEGRQKLLQSMSTVGQSSTMKTNIAQDTVIAFYNAAMAGQLNDAQITLKSGTYNGFDFAQKFLLVSKTDAAGNVTAIDFQDVD